MNNGNSIKDRVSELFASVAAFLVVLVVFFGLGVGIASGTYNTVTNTVGVVNVLGVCFIALPSNAITFTNALTPGGIEPGQNVGPQNEITDNDLAGNVNSNILVSGSLWSNTVLSITFGQGNTLWNPSSQATYVGNALPLAPSLTDTHIVVTFGPATGANVFFGLAIPPSQVAALYTQNIVIENSC